MSLAAALALSEASKEAALVALLDAAVAARDVDGVGALVAALSAEALDTKVARVVLVRLASALTALIEASWEANRDFARAASHGAVERLVARGATGAIDEADFALRLVLYKLLWTDADVSGVPQDYGEAAKKLRDAAGLAGGRETLSVQVRAEGWVQVAQAFLKAEDDVGAEAAVNAALLLVNKTNDAGDALVTWDWVVQFKACRAQLKDSKKAFLEAARLYGELSRLPSSCFDEASMLELLLRAVRCVLLAPAGPSRQRVMGTFMRDERIKQVDVRP